MAAVLKQQASSVGAGAAVDVPELVEQPKLALLPVLKRLDGWQEVRAHRIVCMRQVLQLRITAQRVLSRHCDSRLDLQPLCKSPDHRLHAA